MFETVGSVELESRIQISISTLLQRCRIVHAHSKTTSFSMKRIELKVEASSHHFVSCHDKGIHTESDVRVRIGHFYRLFVITANNDVQKSLIP